jgi:alpha/beta superfamily hydrolase
MPVEEDVIVEVPDGPALEARLSPAGQARGGLVVCHPHPLYGGDMDNPVVVRVAEVGAEYGLSTLRFNFRGVGRSGGTHGRGDGEQDDLKAALGMLGHRLPPGVPVGLAGYSFGAWVAAQVAASDVSLAALCLIAPPLSMFDFAALDGRDRETLVVAGTQDTYCPTAGLAALAEQVPAARVDTIDGADHFFFGKLFPLGELIRSWAGRWAADR